MGVEIVVTKCGERDLGHRRKHTAQSWWFTAEEKLKSRSEKRSTCPHGYSWGGVDAMSVEIVLMQWAWKSWI